MTPEIKALVEEARRLTSGSLAERIPVKRARTLLPALAAAVEEQDRQYEQLRRMHQQLAGLNVERQREIIDLRGRSAGAVTTLRTLQLAAAEALSFQGDDAVTNAADAHRWACAAISQLTAPAVPAGDTAKGA